MHTRLGFELYGNAMAPMQKTIPELPTMSGEEAMKSLKLNNWS
jgi:hypothetical protein